MRTRTEIELLNLRQRYRDYLNHLKSLAVVPLKEYSRVYIRFLACNVVLNEYRSKYKYKDIA
jgi:hypothetical protein